MERGEIWWTKFEHSEGGEIQGDRAVVIISNDRSNKYLNRVQVIPITTNTEHIYPSEVVLTSRKKPSKAMADQIATISKHRLYSHSGRLSPQDMDLIGNAVKRQLGLV